jgi:hypothetical protein
MLNIMYVRTFVEECSNPTSRIDYGMFVEIVAVLILNETINVHFANHSVALVVPNPIELMTQDRHGHIQTHTHTHTHTHAHTRN